MAKEKTIKFGQWLREKREEKKLTQKDLAQALGLKQAAVSRFEKGRLLPGPKVIRKLAKEFGVAEKFVFQMVDSLRKKKVCYINPDSLMVSLKDLDFLGEVIKGLGGPAPFHLVVKLLCARHSYQSFPETPPDPP